MWNLLSESGDPLLTEAGDNLVRDREIRFAAATTGALTSSALMGLSRQLSGEAVGELTAGAPPLGIQVYLFASAEASGSAFALLLVNPLNIQFPERSQRIFLADIDAFDPITETTLTYRFSSGLGYDNAGTYYVPRIENPALFSREMGTPGQGGKASASWGELTLINGDRMLDAMGNDFFDGRTMTLRVGEQSADIGTFTTVMKSTIASLALERERISVRLRDKSVILDKPFSDAKFGGTNALPDGIDGTADDIKDQYKPRVLGRIALMQPTLVNTSKLIYMVNNGAVDGILNVFDAGVYLSRGADYADQAAMELTEPAQGTWRACPSIGCFRLGSVAYGQISACVVEAWDYLDNTAAGLIQRILTEKGLTSSDWVATDFATLNSKNAGSLGLIVEGGETTASLIDRICQSVGAWWGFDALNRFRVARFDAPSGTPVATLTDSEILDIERQPEDQLPLWQTTLKADLNYVVQDKKSLAGVVPADRAAWLEQESRDQKAENATVKTQRLLADSTEYDSSLNGISIAQAESARRLALFSVRRDVVTLTLADPVSRYATLDLGAVINLASDTLGYGTGRLMTITRVQVDWQAGTLDITCWG